MVFRYKGTVWGSVITPCLLNTALCTIILILRAYFDTSLSYDRGNLDALTFVVGFLVVKFLDLSYARFLAAEKELYDFLQMCRHMAILAAVDTGRDESENAQIWRDMVKKELTSLLNISIEILMDPERSNDYVCNHLEDDGNVIRKAEGGSATGPYECLRRLSYIITQQKYFLQEPLVIQKEMKMHEAVSRMNDTLSYLYAISATPVPFNLTNLSRTAFAFWLLSASFFEFDDGELSGMAAMIKIPVVFFVTFGVLGFDAVSNEITDPFGDDPNDLEMEAYRDVSKSTLVFIKRSLLLFLEYEF